MDVGEIDRRARALLASTGTSDPAHAQPDLDIEAGYAIAARIRAIRQARGESPIGRKIGFTNTTILERYGISRPMWGPVYDSTCHNMGSNTEVETWRFSEPRIEPEIVLRIGTPPAAGMTVAALLDCVDAVAFGFEIVQSVFANWRFSPAEAIAAQGLHGALYVGQWHDIAADRTVWGKALGNFTVTLLRNGKPADEGHGHNVLGGPLKALAFLVEEISTRSQPGLVSGEIITTGTLTDAWPIRAGEVWSARLEGLPIADITLSTAGKT